MNYLLNLLISGVVAGALYGMLAMGFAIIYKVSHVVNFALGEMMALIAFIAYSVALATQSNLLVVALAIIVAAVCIGALLERLIIRPMLGRPVFSVVMMTIALSVLIRAVIGLLWGSDPLPFPGSDSGETWTVFGVRLLPIQAVLLGLYLAICAGVWAFFRYSVLGIAMRATATDPTVSLLMGVPISRIYRVAWALSALLAGTAGVLFAKINQVGLHMAGLGIRAFPATILGGLDSVLGSGFAGIVIGVIENLAGGYLGSGFKDVAGFALILVILMVRPFGLFGEKKIERV